MNGRSAQPSRRRAQALDSPLHVINRADLESGPHVSWELSWGLTQKGPWILDQQAMCSRLGWSLALSKSASSSGRATVTHALAVSESGAWFRGPRRTQTTPRGAATIQRDFEIFAWRARGGGSYQDLLPFVAGLFECEARGRLGGRGTREAYKLRGQALSPPTARACRRSAARRAPQTTGEGGGPISLPVDHER